MSEYRLSDFDEKHIEKAKEFLKKAFYGYLTACLDNKVDEWIEGLNEVSFDGEDTFRFQFEIETKGNDFLAAIGVSVNEEKVKKRMGL